MAYARTTICEALVHRTLQNQSLSPETFEGHHIHSTTTLRALTTRMRTRVAYLLDIIVAFRVISSASPTDCSYDAHRSVLVRLSAISDSQASRHSSPAFVAHIALVHSNIRLYAQLSIRTLDSMLYARAAFENLVKCFYNSPTRSSKPSALDSGHSTIPTSSLLILTRDPRSPLTSTCYLSFPLSFPFVYIISHPFRSIPISSDHFISV